MIFGKTKDKYFYREGWTKRNPLDAPFDVICPSG